jgi:nitrogen fixation protein NifU and related proteins
MAAPYDEILMDHIRNARNYRIPDLVSREFTGCNVLCGDELTLYISVTSDCIEDIAFQCSCCGICMASASIMTEIVDGKTLHEAEALLQAFIDVLSQNSEETPLLVGREQRAILETARKFPARARCAALAWTTLRTGLNAALR